MPEHLPNARGFDYFFGMRNGNHAYFPTARRNRLYRNGEPIDTIEEPYLTDWFTSDAIDFIGEPGETPWLMYLSYNTPHTPLQAKDEDLERFAHIPHQGRRTYAAMQWCMDYNIGRIIEHLRATDQLDNTLIVFMSDNGGSVDASNACNAPLNGQKGIALEGGIRVPLIFHWPAGGLVGGTTYERPIIAFDLLPTFLAAAGEGEMPGNLDGVDLLPFLRGDTGGDPHDVLFWRKTLRDTAVRKGDWKLITSVHHLPMLFNLKEDISEQHNVFADHPDIAEDLQQEINRWQESLADTPNLVEGNNWLTRTRRLYDRPFQLVQPERDEAYSGRPRDVRSASN